MKRFIKFLFAGGTAAASNLLFFYILLNIVEVWYLLSSVVSFLLSVVVGFFLQKYITFKDDSKTSLRKQAIIFLIISLINLGINVLLMLLFVEVFRIMPLFAKAITLAILACWNFFVYQYFVFNKKS